MSHDEEQLSPDPMADDSDAEVTPTSALLRAGMRHGVMAYLDLAKVIAPAYVAVAVLDRSGLIAVLGHWLAPAMSIFKLPGEAAVVLVTGWALSLYAALGAATAMKLSPFAVTSVGFMLLLCHALFVEGAVLHKMGVRVWRVSLMRLAVSALAGLLFAWTHPGQEIVPVASASATALPLGDYVWQKVIDGGSLLGLVALVVIVVTALSELARERHVFTWMARKLSSSLGRFAPGEGYLIPLIIGLFVGLMYGGGAMIGIRRAGIIKDHEARAVGLFLSLCHSIVEDPLLLIYIGGSWFWLVVARVLISIAVMPLLRRWA